MIDPTKLFSCAAALCLAVPAHASWTLISDDGSTGFVGNGTVAADPADASNDVYSITNNTGNVNDHEAYILLGGGIANNTTGTLFFRMRATSVGGAGAELVDWVAGSSDLAAPDNNWGNFEGYVRISDNNIAGDLDLDVRNGGGFTEVGAADDDTWFNVWLVLDNTADTTAVYYNSIPGADATDPSTISLTGSGFRNGTTDPLVTLYMRNSENGTTGYIDDIYLDTTGQNQVNPIPEPSSIGLLGLAGLGLISRRRRK